MPLFLFFEVYPMWGYSIRISPESKGRIAYRYPPPTTIIGAFCASLQRVLGERMEILREDLSYAEKYRDIIENVFISVKGLDGMTYGDPLKYLSNYKGKEIKSNVIAVPSTFTVAKGVRSRISVILKFNEKKMAEKNLEEKDLERAAWGIWRLGSKESIVSVEHVRWIMGEEIKSGRVETGYTFIYDPEVDVVDHSKIYIQRVIDWRNAKIGEYIDSKTVYLAYPLSKVKISRSRPFKCYLLENKEIVVEG